jgi:hypothetical protein
MISMACVTEPGKNAAMDSAPFSALDILAREIDIKPLLGLALHRSSDVLPRKFTLRSRLCKA